jgi:hypothetical protein
MLSVMRFDIFHLSKYLFTQIVLPNSAINPLAYDFNHILNLNYINEILSDSFDSWPLACHYISD